MFSGKLSQCISEPRFSGSSDKKTADLAFWGAVFRALCSCCICQGSANLRAATWLDQLPVLLCSLTTITPRWQLLGFAHELPDQDELWDIRLLSPGSQSWWRLWQPLPPPEHHSYQPAADNPHRWVRNGHLGQHVIMSAFCIYNSRRQSLLKKR